MEPAVIGTPRVRQRVQPCPRHDSCSRLAALAFVELGRYGVWLVSMSCHHLGRKADPVYVVDRLFLTLNSKDRPPDGLNFGPVAEAVVEAMPPLGASRR